MDTTNFPLASVELETGQVPRKGHRVHGDRKWGRVSLCDLRVGYGTECPALALTMAVSAALIVPGGKGGVRRGQSHY